MFRKPQTEPQIRNMDGSAPRVEWITATPGLVETYPIVPARTALPQWFKDSPTRIPRDQAHGHGRAAQEPPPASTGTTVGPASYDKTSNPTIRACPGIVDVMRAGYLLRAWTDIEINTPEPPRGPDDQFQAKTAMNPQETGGKIGAFGPGLNQKIPLWPGEYAFALKFDSPWVCKTPPGYSLLYSPVPYAEQQPYRVLPGITDNDTFHIVNLLIMWNHHGSYLIEAGTPLCWLLPVYRDGYNLPTDVIYDPDRDKVLRAVGKGGVGQQGGRIIHGSYILERAKARKARP